MPGNAADALVDTLERWGVEVIFGLPGDLVDGVIESLRKRQDRVKFIMVRHEEAAAFMATAYAKYTGKLGVCLSTAGPGAIHLLNGLYDAKLDGHPVLAITGQVYSDLLGSHYQQEVALNELFKDVAVYTQQINSAKEVPVLADIACRTALSHRSVAHISFPIDIQEEPAPSDSPEPRAGWGHTSKAFSVPVVVPSNEDLQRAADVLNEGKRITMLVGQGALNARTEVLELAEKLGSPIVKALLGKGVVPDEHPLTTGGIGFLGTTPSVDAMDNCDTLLIVGSTFPYVQYYPKPGKARGIQVDIDASRIGLRYPVEVGLVGDTKETLRALIPLVEYNTDRSFLESAQRGMKEWWSLMEDRATHAHPGALMKPQAVAWHLNGVLDSDAIVSTDSGTITTWIARQFKLRGEQMFSLAGNLATMAPGLPYAIAAKVAFPERQSVAFVGDGGFSMLMAEFTTAVKYNLPILVVVIRNNILGQIKWEQIVFLGNPQFGVELQNPDFAKYAEICGGVGFRVEDPTELDSVFKQALSAGKPAIVEAIVDPNEPPWPPKIEAWQVKNFAEALVKGQPSRRRLMLTLFRDRVDEVLRG